MPDQTSPKPPPAPRPSPRGLGPEDAVGQIVTIGGVTYRWTATGPETVEGSPEDLEAIRAAMADPKAGRNPAGNPYAP